MLPIWVYVVVGGVAANAFTFARLYKTAASRASLSSPALTTRRSPSSTVG
jgi:hypothetical protein